jgi:hypothetical protein
MPFSNARKEFRNFVLLSQERSSHPSHLQPVPNALIVSICRETSGLQMPDTPVALPTTMLKRFSGPTIASPGGSRFPMRRLVHTEKSTCQLAIFIHEVAGLVDAGLPQQQ